ncbi:MAG: molybdopterin-guanine dinucleotide biosynthesis protein B [Candidatus Limnocylindria bacterium]
MDGGARRDPALHKLRPVYGERREVLRELRDAGRRSLTVPAIAFVGRHDSGKTTFLLALLPLLRSRSLRVGYLKHAHAGFDIDQPGKDSYRARRAGAVQTIVTGGGRTAVIDEHEVELGLAGVLERYAGTDLDLLVVEGFKREPLPKIEVARAALSTELVCGGDPRLLAVVADFVPAGVARCFAPEDAPAVADFVVTRIVSP